MQIQDLNKDLDTKEQSEVRGGDNGNSAVSNVLQEMGIEAPVAVGYGAGSAGNTFVNVNGNQNGSTSTGQKAGDEFGVFLGSLGTLKSL